VVVLSGPYSKQEYSLILSHRSWLLVISLEFQPVFRTEIAHSHDGKSAAQAFDRGPGGEKIVRHLFHLLSHQVYGQYMVKCPNNAHRFFCPRDKYLLVARFKACRPTTNLPLRYWDQDFKSHSGMHMFAFLMSSAFRIGLGFVTG
jgi:hypothetical protein